MERKYGQSVRGSTFRHGRLVRLGVFALLCGFPGLSSAQSQQAPADTPPSGAPQTGTSQKQGTGGEQQADQASPGTITGTVLDQTGTPVVGAQVKLTRDDPSLDKELITGDEGEFLLTDVVPGPYQLTISAPGFATQSTSGLLHSGETFIIPQIVLALSTVVTQVNVTPETIKAEAEAEVKEEETQRVFGIIPNFYVTYAPHPVPLTPGQKFALAGRSIIDPVTFLGAGAVAGIDQGFNRYSAYGQGAQGYGKRFGAAYADIFAGTIIGSALMPSLLKQDPRFFYKGRGTKGAKLLYALANGVICKGDNGRWQPNYSDFLGGVIVGGLSNAYYPANDRGVGLVFSTVGTRIAESAFAGIFQEFINPLFSKNPGLRSATQP